MKTNKFITLITLVAFTFVTLFSPFPGPSSKANAQGTGSLRLVTSSASFSFKKDLQLGDTDPDVKELQKILNSSVDTLVSTSGVGSAGQESTYFGNLTKSAVVKFQNKYKSEILTPNGLTVGNGAVGRTTRTKLNLLLGVTETLASVGLPQSRANNNTTSPSVPTNSSVSASNAEICRFVEILISSAVIAPDKANPARSALNCPLPSNPVIVPTPAPVTPTAVCQFVDLLININVIAPDKANSARLALNCTLPVNPPSVDLKVDGRDGPVSVLPGTEIRLSWKSYNTKSCNDGLNTLPTSGAVRLKANTSLSYPMSCIGLDGTSVVDTVTVIVSNSSGQNATSTIQVLSSNITPGYDFATFDAITNVPTKMVIVYTNQPTVESSVKVFESPTVTKNHSYKIAGLTPNSTYYARVAFIVSQTDNIMTEELTFTTLVDSSLANAEVSQRVLSSPSGQGVVTIPESESLKTNSAVTLEAWVKPTAWSTKNGMSNTMDQVIISKGNIGGNIDYVLSLDQGKLVYSNNDASLWTCSPVVPLNQWTHVAVSVSETSSNISLYVGGVKQNSICEGPKGAFSGASKINKSKAITEYIATTTSTTGAWGATPATTASSWGSTSGTTGGTGNDTSLNLNSYQITSNIYFGNFYPKYCNATSTDGNGFVGLMDDIKIWNTARTATQIKADLASSTASTSLVLGSDTYLAPEANLVGHWSFDDGRATDLTYYGNNGAIKGDMEVIIDETAPSPISDSEFALNGLEFNFPESCDADLNPLADELAGYKITFRGGVKSVTPSGEYSLVELETCDDPAEELVKSVEIIGKAPARDKSYYNNMGTISVIIVPSLGMKVPKVGETIQGTAIQYISGNSEYLAVQESVGSASNSVGYADNWTPQAKTCMKPKDSGLFGLPGNWGIVGAVVVVVAACVFTGCIGAAAAAPSLTAFLSAVNWTATAVVASAGYMGGSMIECDKGTVGCM